MHCILACWCRTGGRKCRREGGQQIWHGLTQPTRNFIVWEFVRAFVRALFVRALSLPPSIRIYIARSFLTQESSTNGIGPSVPCIFESLRETPPSLAKTRNPIPKTRRTACGRQPHFRGMTVDAQWYPRKSAAAVSPPDSPCYQPGLFPFTFDDEGPLGLTLDEGYRDHGPRIMSLVPDSQAERLNVPIGHAYIASVNGTDLNAKSQSFKQRHEMIANAKRPLVLHVWVPPRKDETKSVSPPLTPTSPRSPFSLLRSSRSSSASDVRQSL